MALAERTSVPGYGLACPTEADVLKGLIRFLGADGAEELWGRACRSQGVRRPIAAKDHAKLLAVAEGVINDVPGLAQVPLRNVIIKCRNYTMLSKESR